MSSSPAHLGMAFPQGEEEEDEDVGTMPGGIGPLRVPPASIGGRQKCAAGKSRGENALMLIWLFWQCARCLAGLTARHLAPFACPQGFLAGTGLPFPCPAGHHAQVGFVHARGGPGF